jgi:major type 1 subunit fimbrin (pilin)
VKRFALILTLTAAPVMAFAAANNTITFKGQVSDQTCQVSINGNAANPVVLLPTVSAAELNGVGSTAGETPFTIQVSGCTVPASDTPIQTAFLGNDVTSAGNMGNTGTAGNVQIQMLTGAAGTPVVLNGLTSVPGLVLPAAQSSASHDFAVRYISEAGGAAAGTVSASAVYALDYL